VAALDAANVFSLPVSQLGQRSPVVGTDVSDCAFPVPTAIPAGDVMIGLVGAGDRVLHERGRAIDDDLSLKPTGPAKPAAPVAFCTSASAAAEDLVDANTCETDLVES
jgi:hypothetical protein